MENYRLLIADDEPIIRGGLKNVMKWEEIGFTVSGIFPSGNDMIHFLTDNPADVILSDIAMENGTGLDVAEWVEKNSPSTKIVLITGYTDYQAAQKAVSYSCVRHLINKPVSIIVLKKIFLQLFQEFEEQHQLLTSQNMLHIECVKQFLQGNPFGSRIWQSLSLYCVVIQAAENQSIRNAPLLHSEKMNFDYNGLLHRQNGNLLFLYPCSSDQADDLAESANTYLLQERNTSDAEIFLFKQKEELLQFVKERQPIIDTVASDLKRDMDAYLEVHLSEKISLNDAAEYMHYSPSHFSRKFKSLTGVGFTAYIMNKRLEKAQRLLRETELSISSVASASGFENDHYFCYVFRQKMNLSPSAYRRSFHQ